MPTFNHNGANIFFETWGEGEKCLTLINGTSRTSTDFKSMANHFVRLGFKIVTLDNRGSGKTETSLDFTLSDCAKDVIALWDHLHITRSTLLGMSLGGMIALETAATTPKRIEKLFLISTGFPVWLKKRGQFKDEEDYLTSYFSKDFLETHRILANSLMKQMRISFFDTSEKTRTEAQRKAFETQTFKSHYHLPFETHILHGEEDRIIPKEAAHELHRAITPSTIHLYPGVGHLFLVEMPKQFYEKVAGLL